MLQKVLQSAPFSMRDWAEQAGVSYPAFRSWAYGRRVPSTDRVEDLADALDARADRLRQLARELRSAAETGEEAGGE